MSLRAYAQRSHSLQLSESNNQLLLEAYVLLLISENRSVHRLVLPSQTAIDLNIWFLLQASTYLPPAPWRCGPSSLGIGVLETPHASVAPWRAQSSASVLRVFRKSPAQRKYICGGRGIPTHHESKRPRLVRCTIIEQVCIDSHLLPVRCG